MIPILFEIKAGICLSLKKRKMIDDVKTASQYSSDLVIRLSRIVKTQGNRQR